MPEAGCGHCEFCITNTPVVFLHDRNQKERRGRIDEAKVKKILAATKVRDDARFLARVAFGISSPRVTTEKLGKQAVFGCMQECDFEVCVPRLTTTTLLYTALFNSLLCLIEWEFLNANLIPPCVYHFTGSRPPLRQRMHLLNHTHTHTQTSPLPFSTNKTLHKKPPINATEPSCPEKGTQPKKN